MPVAVLRPGERTLRSPAEFQRVLRRGRTFPATGVMVHALRREDDGPGRHGLVVSRRHGGAVERNRVKRQLRAALRLAGGMPRGIDGVITVRPGARVEVQSLSKELYQILEMIGREGS